eukprot:scaffold180945_cov45-Prasinocladus_malaysianus.AAC.1
MEPSSTSIGLNITYMPAYISYLRLRDPTSFAISDPDRLQQLQVSANRHQGVGTDHARRRGRRDTNTGSRRVTTYKQAVDGRPRARERLPPGMTNIHRGFCIK